MKKNIALLAGGYSGEYDISVQSAATIRQQLDPEQYWVFTILISKKKWVYQSEDGAEIAIDKNDFSLKLPEGHIHFDAVFFAIHGTPGEDGKLQGYFDMLQIPYTGCGVITSSITFNKSYCNKVVKNCKSVKVARSCHLFRDRPYQLEEILSNIQLPAFVKPAEGGSSLGMSKVKEPDQLPDAIKKAFEADNQILIEEAVIGRELTCGVFRTADKWHPLAVTEIKCSKDFFDYEAKYTPGLTKEVTPAQIDPNVKKRIYEASHQLYDILNCRGVVRFDFILEAKTSELYFLEVNTMPGQSPGSIVPQQLKAAKLDPGRFYGTLIEACLA